MSVNWSKLSTKFTLQQWREEQNNLYTLTDEHICSFANLVLMWCFNTLMMSMAVVGIGHIYNLMTLAYTLDEQTTCQFSVCVYLPSTKMSYNTTCVCTQPPSATRRIPCVALQLKGGRGQSHAHTRTRVDVSTPLLRIKGSTARSKKQDQELIFGNLLVVGGGPSIYCCIRCVGALRQALSVRAHGLWESNTCKVVVGV